MQTVSIKGSNADFSISALLTFRLGLSHGGLSRIGNCPVHCGMFRAPLVSIHWIPGEPTPPNCDNEKYLQTL